MIHLLEAGGWVLLAWLLAVTCVENRKLPFWLRAMAVFFVVVDAGNAGIAIAEWRAT